MATETKSTGVSGGAWALAGAQILSGFLQADQVKRQAETQARIAEFNAQLADYDAWKAEAYGSTLMARMQNDTDQMRGSTKVFAASKGVKIEGSLADVNAENELNSLLNKMDVDNRTTEQAMGYKRQASQIRLGSSLNSMASQLQASSMQVGSVAQAAGTVGANYISNQKVTKEDLKLPEANTPSGYSSFKINNGKSYEPLGFSLMPGGQ